MCPAGILPDLTTGIKNISVWASPAHCSLPCGHLLNVINSCRWPQKKSLHKTHHMPSANASLRTSVEYTTGNGGVPTSLSVNGERYARITPRMGQCGRTLRTTKLEAAPIDGEKTDFLELLTDNVVSVSPSLSGTPRTLS